MCSVKSSNRRSKWSLEMHRPKAFETNHVGPPMLSFQTQHMAEAVANRKVNNNQIMEKKAWETATNPLKQIPMNLLLMYMSGNGISIFPIMMIGMMLLRTVKALLSTNAVFKEFESPTMSSTESHGYNRTAIGSLQRLIYLLGNCINIALAVYKCQSMGLLPTHSSDWLAFIQPRVQVEFTAGGFPLS